MALGPASYGLGFVAGLLATLSPCVLPILPVLLASALQAHPRAPWALAAGLACSYALFGTLLAWAAANLGFDTSRLQAFGAIVLGLFGLVLLSAGLQQRLAVAGAGVAQAGHALLARLPLEGLAGQFGIGAVLGLVWSPCVGPTLGAAVLLASRGSHLAEVALLMGLFGLGAALPILVLAFVSRAALSRAASRMLQTGRAGRALLGVVLIVVALLLLSGANRAIETWLVAHSPAWLTALSTRF